MHRIAPYHHMMHDSVTLSHTIHEFIKMHLNHSELYNDFFSSPFYNIPHHPFYAFTSTIFHHSFPARTHSRAHAQISCHNPFPGAKAPTGAANLVGCHCHTQTLNGKNLYTAYHIASFCDLFQGFECEAH